jgi:hypothetical protein
MDEVLGARADPVIGGLGHPGRNGSGYQKMNFNS